MRYWLIYYDDPDCPPELFTDEVVARAVWQERLTNWNCYLFSEVEPIYRPKGSVERGTGG